MNVVDGDTIRVRFGGLEYSVRYIGIDAPETSDPDNPVANFARQALKANRRLVDDRTVFLVKDVSEADQYGRLLRYVWTKSDGAWTLVNAELVRLGMAHAATYPPDVAYVDRFHEIETGARKIAVGLWAAPDSANPAPERTLIPDRTRRPQAPSDPGPTCDPSYPDVCIPAYPPDLDCHDVFYSDIWVPGLDPHGFDGNDNDGWGCES